MTAAVSVQRDSYFKCCIMINRYLGVDVCVTDGWMKRSPNAGIEHENGQSVNILPLPVSLIQSYKTC